jgi:taurine dioxygenase
LRVVESIGAAVRTVDLARVTKEEVAAIKRAWYHHDLLLFRLSDDNLLSFSRHFGLLDSPPNQWARRKSPEGYPRVYIVSNVMHTDTCERTKGDGWTSARP